MVETEFGFHIIKAEERRTASISDDSTRQKIKQKLQQEKIEKEMQHITASSRIEVAEDFPVEVEPETKPKPAITKTGITAYFIISY